MAQATAETSKALIKLVPRADISDSGCRCISSCGYSATTLTSYKWCKTNTRCGEEYDPWIGQSYCELVDSP